MRKGQTAMEYLMTYGWAILIIIVVVAALYSLGVFSVKPSIACSPCFSYFAFVDYDQTNGILYIRNGPRTIYWDGGAASGGYIADPDAGATILPDVDSDGIADLCTDATDTCAPGKDIVFTEIDITGSIDITLDFIDASTLVSHSDTATIINR